MEYRESRTKFVSLQIVCLFFLSSHKRISTPTLVPY